MLSTVVVDVDVVVVVVVLVVVVVVVVVDIVVVVVAVVVVAVVVVVDCFVLSRVGPVFKQTTNLLFYVKLWTQVRHAVYIYV